MATVVPRVGAVAFSLVLVAATSGCGSTNESASPTTTVASPVTTSAPSPSTARAATPGASAVRVPAASAGPATPPGSAGPARNPARLDAAVVYQPIIDPADFVETVDNPFWPLVPGTTFTFRSSDERTVTAVTIDRRTVMGVSTVVVHDQVYSGDELLEDTFDWYAQDRSGNVWYFGEDTTSYEDKPSGDHAGSWEAGVDGAQPGVVMLAQPLGGDVYRQEFKVGEAEDLALVRRLDGAIKVPAGAFADVLVTEEWSPLEPDVIELKYYVKGIGVVAERGIFGSDELVRLIRIQRPGG